YLTPAAAKGLELHFDFHDVFVVQLDGHKRWRIWSPLARTEIPVRDGATPPMPRWDEVGEPLFDLTLGPGDCLYLPRGFPHCAETVADASAHLTIGVMARTWQQAIRHALDEALVEPSLREALPVGSLGADVADGPSLAAVGAALNPSTIRRWLVGETWRRQPATRRRPLIAPPVTADGPVAVTPGPLLWLDDGDEPDRITLGMGDRSLDLPAEAYDVLAALFERPDGFVAAAWDGMLDVDSRLVVLERLAAEGVVVPAGPIG
ncbi:MAG: JmjC domain-containing protein, partial [Desertimonas sp.]